MLRLLGILICALALAACGDDDDSGSEASGGGGGGGAETAAQEPQAEGPTATGGCEDVEQPEPKPDGGAERPSGRLDQKTSPKTAASFANLARTGFYDDTVFHRIVPGFVIQGGDRTASGTGGPGYSTRDVPPPNTTYTKGVVAMAKSQLEPPGTAGSQFYIVTAPDAGLTPDYALLGEVVEGQDVVDRIGELGDPASGGAGTPLQPVVIESAELSER